MLDLDDKEWEQSQAHACQQYMTEHNWQDWVWTSCDADNINIFWLDGAKQSEA